MSAVTVYDGNFSFQTTSSIKLRGWPMPRVKQMANHIAQRWMQMVRLWHIKQMEPHMHSVEVKKKLNPILKILTIFSKNFINLNGFFAVLTVFSTSRRKIARVKQMANHIASVECKWYVYDTSSKWCHTCTVRKGRRRRDDNWHPYLHLLNWINVTRIFWAMGLHFGMFPDLILLLIRFAVTSI